MRRFLQADFTEAQVWLVLGESTFPLETLLSISRPTSSLLYISSNTSEISYAPPTVTGYILLGRFRMIRSFYRICHDCWLTHFRSGVQARSVNSRHLGSDAVHGPRVRESQTLWCILATELILFRFALHLLDPFYRIAATSRHANRSWPALAR